MSTDLNGPVLENGSLECVLAPGCGGGIARLNLLRPDGRRIDLLRPAPTAPWPPCSPLDLGSFPLIPFCNRIAEGRFTFEGRQIQLPIHLPLPHAIHGHGWQAPWEIETAEADRATLVYRHCPDPWPYPYTARQHFHLDRNALVVTIELSNDGDGAMPAGFGLHPYFPKPPGTRLTASVSGVWLGDPTLLPDMLVAPPPDWDLTSDLVMDGVVLDNVFAGWTGDALIAWPDQGIGLRLLADDLFGHLVVWSPPGEAWFCVEPATHMTDAFNRAARGETATGLRVIAPGQTLSGRVIFEAVPLA